MVGEWVIQPVRHPGVYIVGTRQNDLDDQYAIAYVSQRPGQARGLLFYRVPHMSMDWRLITRPLPGWWWWTVPLQFDRLPHSWPEHADAGT